jgi:hypothetical protein
MYFQFINLPNAYFAEYLGNEKVLYVADNIIMCVTIYSPCLWNVTPKELSEMIENGTATIKKLSFY